MLKCFKVISTVDLINELPRCLHGVLRNNFFNYANVSHMLVILYNIIQLSRDLKTMDIFHHVRLKEIGGRIRLRFRMQCNGTVRKS